MIAVVSGSAYLLDSMVGSRAAGTTLAGTYVGLLAN